MGFVDEAWKINTLDLKTVCSFAGIDGPIGGPSFRDPGTFIVGRDGVEEDEDAPLGPWTFNFRCVFPWSDMSGDDAVIAGRNAVLRELYKPAPVLFWTPPRIAVATRTPVRLVGEPMMTGRNEYVFPLRSRIGGFQNVSAASASGSPPTVVTSGTKPISDATLVFSAAGTYELTWPNGRKFTIVAASGPTYPVTINLEGRDPVITDNASANASGAVSFSDPSYLILPAGTTLSHTATVSVTLSWRNLW